MNSDLLKRTLEKSTLGKKAGHPERYSPELLLPIPRCLAREIIGAPSPVPFYGCDVWNAYEISWLNLKGKPLVAVGEFIFPCTSPNLIESKSLKLFLHSLMNTRFKNTEEVIAHLQKDLSACAQTTVEVTLTPLSEIHSLNLSHPEGICLDELDIEINSFSPNASCLTTAHEIVNETLFSDLMISNCPVTEQPDWASVHITYEGPKINRADLLKYLVSYRNHREFHEQCVERIFTDILKECRPYKLTVQACYTRRGGLDINPYRTTESHQRPHSKRLWRQ